MLGVIILSYSFCRKIGRELVQALSQPSILFRSPATTPTQGEDEALTIPLKTEPEPKLYCRIICFKEVDIAFLLLMEKIKQGSRFDACQLDRATILKK